MKIVPFLDPSDVSGHHEPRNAVCGGVMEEGGNMATTTSSPKMLSVLQKSLQGVCDTAVISALSSQSFSDIKAFSENENTSRYLVKLCLEHLRGKEDQGEGREGASGVGDDVRGVGERGGAQDKIHRDALGEGDMKPLLKQRPSLTKKEKLRNNTEVMCEYVRNLVDVPSVPGTMPLCDVELKNLTNNDTKTLAEGMLFILRTGASEEDAVERFLQSYPCMRELAENDRYFSGMHLSLVRRVFSDQQKFAKVKLFVAAALSIGDLMTDIMMIVLYFRTGESGYAWASLGSLLTNLTLQAMVSYTQNRAKPWKRQVREQFYVWSLVKPGVDAWRVASGSAHEVGQLVNAHYELTMNKCCELVAEAIPGALIQLAAIMTADSKPTTNALFSFAFCIFTAAFTSAVQSWDWDINKGNRKKAPWFYGYIPSNVNGKIRVFISLFCLSFFNLITRSFACVLFYMKGGFSMVATLLGAELLIYFLIKGLRRDFLYWTPLYGVGGVFISWLIRWTIKVITDWTAVVHFRHPNEVGGAYFTFSLGITVAMGVVAALQYEKAGVDVFMNRDLEEEGGNEGGGEESGLEESTVVTSMIVACAGMLVSYVFLLSSIKKEYLHTFVSTKTGNEQSQDVFTKNEEDEERFQILNDNRHKWEYKIGIDVKAWIDERLPVWLEEEPEWFNDQKRSRIPDDFVTDPDILVRLRTKNVKEIIEQRRRNSVGLMFVPEGEGGVEEEEEEEEERDVV